jgi:hypothetical protein
MASSDKRKMIVTPVAARVTAAKAARVSRGSARKAPGVAPRAPKTAARKPVAQKTQDKAAERADMLHRSLAVGASAMAKAIRDAHKPIKPAKRRTRRASP